jgi:predicted DNA-binding transcriptional regulator AlpA
VTMTVDLHQTTFRAAEVAELYGVSEWTVYQHPDELPVAPIRVGRTLRWPAAPVLRSLGIES